MTTYTHVNGIIVGGTDRPGQIAIWSALADSPCDCCVHVDCEVVRAIAKALGVES